MIIPNYQISGQQVTPEEIVDIIPEQEASDRQVQINEEKYFQQLKAEGEAKLRADAKLYEGLADLSSTFGNIIQQRQEKYRQDREAEIKLDILTRGVSPELEAQFRGERDSLFEDDLATQEFASKYEAETGDSITAQEFRKMAGWEKYMVAEQYAIQKAKGYDQYVYDAYETTKIDVIRDGQQVTVGHFDNLSPSEQAALDQKIKFEYAKQFAGLNDALVATVVKPEIDKFDEARRRKQTIAREGAYQLQVAEFDSRMIETGFAAANPEDGHQLAHDWAARYAARNRTSISVGRIAFKENLVKLVSENKITYTEAIAIVNHEIEARDGSIKTMASWKEWRGLDEDLVKAARLGTEAKQQERTDNIAADLQVIKSTQNLTNEQKMQLRKVYADKYDGYVPTELSNALQGHIDDEQAEDMIQESIRYQGGVYDFELANVSTPIYNKYKDKIIQSGAMVPGSSEHKEARDLIKSFTNEGTGDAFGETDAKSVEWIMLNQNLNEIFDKAYMKATVRNGVVVGTADDGYNAGMRAVQATIANKGLTRSLMNTNFEDDGDESYERSIQTNILQSSNKQWKTTRLSSSPAIEKKLLLWHQTPLRQSSDLPDYYKDLASRMGVNPIDLANSQIKFLLPDVEIPETEETKYNDKVLNLIYKFPTRSRITRARLEAEGAGEQNTKTSIYNKKALVRKDK